MNHPSSSAGLSPSSLRVLIVEDHPDDAALLRLALEKAGFDPIVQVADDEAEYLACLNPHIDVIIADFTLPQFGALAALRLVQKHGWDIPLIVVSGSISEEVAVETIKQGAADYLLKDRLARIGPAVRRALQERQLRREKQLAFSALEQSEARLREAQRLAQLGYWEWEIRTGLLWWSDETYRIFGLDPHSAAPTFEMFMQHVHPDDVARVQNVFRSSVEKGTPFELEHRIVTSQGDTKAVSVKSETAMCEDGHSVRFAGMVQDITKRKTYEMGLVEAREQAEATARLRTTILNNMSHEIRTPLTGILGFAEILVEEVPDAYRDFAEVVFRSGKRLADTLNSVLDLARLDAGTLTSTASPVDVAADVADVVRLYDTQARMKGIDLRLTVPEEPLWAEIDPAVLSRVVINLVDNGLKFTEKGHVAVELEANQTNVWLRIQDTGIGISEDFLPQIYNDFTQESNGLTRSHEGSGLGLSITRRLVDLVGGSIEVNSQQGIGTRFVVRLPRFASPDAKDDAESPAFTPIPSLARILSVEDHPDTQVLLQHLLRHLYTVDIASDGDEALRLAGRTTYDAVLLDVNLGTGMSGLDVIRELREQPAYTDTPIIAVTAHAMPEDKSRLLLSGFNEYLSKPFTRSKLLSILHNALATSEV